jgi:hypothetical protein
MGYALSWVAVRGTPRDRVLEIIGASPTGEREEIPESDLVGASLPTGFYVVVANDVELDESLVAELSMGGEAILCSVEEHVMTSRAYSFVDGKEQWRITHVAELGIDHLEASGELPPIYAGLRDQQLANQRRGDADYVFDVPVLVAKSLTGFRHDEDIDGAEAEPFEVLETFV